MLMTQMNRRDSIINRKFFLGIFPIVLMVMLSFTANGRTLIFQSSGTSQDSNTPAPAVTQQQNTVSTEQYVSQPINQAPVMTDPAISANSELFFMLEQLQQEVNTLRGIIEEQGHELRILKQNSRDRYVDLDSRVLDLTKRVSEASKNSSVAPTGRLGNETAIASPVSVETPKSSATEMQKQQAREIAPIPQREPTKAENDAYSAAYAFIKDKKFDDAILALFAYTENYPDSPLLPNVYYWLGEVYLATSKLEQAKTSFSLVMTAYPDNPKVSDAIYKLAVTLDRLGQKDQAKQYLSEVQRKYPNTSAAKLAGNYTLTP